MGQQVRIVNIDGQTFFELAFRNHRCYYPGDSRTVAESLGQNISFLSAMRVPFDQRERQLYSKFGTIIIRTNRDKETWEHFRKEEESNTNPVLVGIFPQYRSEPGIIHKPELYSAKDRTPYSIVASNEEVEEAKRSLGELEGEMTPAESAGWVDVGAATPPGDGATSALGGP